MPPGDVSDGARGLRRRGAIPREPAYAAGRLAGEEARRNATILALPTALPSRISLEDRGGPPEQNVRMGGPTARWPTTRARGTSSVCAHAGAALPSGSREHATDAIYRYDLRSLRWLVALQHDPGVVPRGELGEGCTVAIEGASSSPSSVSRVGTGSAGEAGLHLTGNAPEERTLGATLAAPVLLESGSHQTFSGTRRHLEVNSPVRGGRGRDDRARGARRRLPALRSSRGFSLPGELTVGSGTALVLLAQ